MWRTLSGQTPKFCPPIPTKSYRGNPSYFGQSYARNDQPRYYHPRYRQHFNPQSNINSQNLNFQCMQSQAKVRLLNAPYFQSLHQPKSFVTLVDTLTKSNQCSQRATTNSSGKSFPFQRQVKD